MLETSVQRKRPRDPKVAEICLTVLSDQDVVLDALRISMRVHLIIYFAYWAYAAM